MHLLLTITQEVVEKSNKILITNTKRLWYNYFMINRRGFTLVELIVVIVVIAILATLATLGFNRYLEDGRDNRRTANATTIAEALEKYYDKNGEYPSCANVC